MKKADKTDAEWRAELTPEQYRILRQGGLSVCGLEGTPHAFGQAGFQRFKAMLNVTVQYRRRACHCEVP